MARPEIVGGFTCQTTLNPCHTLQSMQVLLSQYFVIVLISPTGRRLPRQGGLFHSFTRSAALSLRTCVRWKQRSQFDIDTPVSSIRWAPLTTITSELFTSQAKRRIDTHGARQPNGSFWEWTSRSTRELAP